MSNSITMSPVHESYSIENIENLLKQVTDNKYRFTDPIPEKPPYLISIGGKGIALPGSLIGVYGQPKSRKSSLMGLIKAALMDKRGIHGIIETNIKGKILWVDTEQSDIENQYFQNNVITISGLNVDDADYIDNRQEVLKMRPYDEITRLALIDYYLAQHKPEEIGALFIDGVADLMYNVNDLEESKKLVTRLTNWADTYQIPIFVALHTNKDGMDATGAVGGLINKKASYTIKTSIEYEHGPTLVSPYYVRSGEIFPPFKIANDENGAPTFMLDEDLDNGGAIVFNNTPNKYRKNDKIDYGDLGF